MLFSSLPSVLVQPGAYPSKFAGGRGRLSESFFWGSLSLARFFSNPFRKCFAPSVRALFVVLAVFWLALSFCFPSCAGHFRVGFRIAPLLCWLLRVAVVVQCRASRDRRARRRFIFGNSSLNSLVVVRLNLLNWASRLFRGVFRAFWIATRKCVCVCVCVCVCALHFWQFIT